MEKKCSCTGHRPQKFPFEYGGRNKEFQTYLKELESKIKAAITEYGVTCFISGMSLGVDLDFAEIVLKLRKKYSLKLECAIPCPNQTIKWDKNEIARYNRILKKTDSITLVSERYTPECMLKRNRYMVDKSDLVIAVFNGIEKGGTWYTIQYAERRSVPILILNLKNKNTGDKL